MCVGVCVLRVLDADARHVRRRVRAGRCVDARANARAEVRVRAVPLCAQVVREGPVHSPRAGFVGKVVMKI